MSSFFSIRCTASAVVLRGCQRKGYMQILCNVTLEALFQLCLCRSLSQSSNVLWT